MNKLAAEKHGQILLKNVLLKIYFQNEGSLYANCFLYTLTIYLKCLLFWFLGRGIPICIPIVTPVQNGRISSWTNGYILLKKILVKLNLEGEGCLYANCLFDILSIYFQVLLFQFLSRGIPVRIPILTWIQNRRIYGLKNGHFLIKMDIVW